MSPHSWSVRLAEYRRQDNLRGIGLHHLHHLSSKIPFYRLPMVLKDWPELEPVRRLTVRESANCVKLTLWDEQSKRLISFKQAEVGLPTERANVA